MKHSVIKRYSFLLILILAIMLLLYAFVFHSSIKSEGSDENVFQMKDVHSGALTGYGSYEVAFKSLDFEAEKFLNMKFNAMQTMYVNGFALKLNIDDIEKFKKGMTSADSIDTFRGFMLNVDSGLVRGRMINAVEMKGVRFEFNIAGGKRFIIASDRLLMKRGKPVMMAATVIADLKTGKTYGALGCTFDRGFSRIKFSREVYLMEGEKQTPVELRELVLF